MVIQKNEDVSHPCVSNMIMSKMQGSMRMKSLSSLQLN